MYLVSKKILFDVMSHKKDIKFKDVTSSQIDKLDETDNSEQSIFRGFMENAYKIYSFALNSDDIDKMYRWKVMVKQYIADNKDIIRYVDAGSSRMVYALANGTILKIATNKAGQAQNNNEANICMNPLKKYNIFPDFYDADERYNLALNCEMCAKAHSHDFYEILGFYVEDLCQVIDDIISTETPDSKFNDLCDKYKRLNFPILAHVVKNIMTK